MEHREVIPPNGRSRPDLAAIHKGLVIRTRHNARQTGFVSRSGVRVMAYRLASLRLATAMGAVLVGPMAPASASCGWGGWFGQERPVIYRPVVTPRTYYFAPAASTEVIPAPVIRRVHPHRHRHHRPYR